MKQPLFKIRCSAIGDIMTNSRKKGELSKTAQSYCQQWLKERIYGTRKQIYSKYLDKGIQLEMSAIAFVENYYHYDFLVKNEKHFESDYLTGTPDIITPKEIRDTKCSWDCFTFPLFEQEVDKGYWWQMQGYMALTGRNVAYVDYVLLDTPEELDQYAPTYDNVKDKYKIKSFKVERDNDAILSIYERVKECREYINQLI